MLAQAENRHQCFVDSPLLFRGNPADQVSQTAGVDRAHLLNEDLRVLAMYVDLWPERSGPGAARGWRYQHDRPGQKLIGLDHDAESPPLLLVALPAWHPDLVYVTPEHAGSP
jgi:hypothetical protein